MKTTAATKKNSKAYSTLQLLRDIWSAVRPNRGRFLCASFLRFSGDAAFLYASYALAAMVTFFSHYEFGGSLHEFWWLLGSWGVVFIYTINTRQLAKFLGYQVAERANIHAQLEATEHLSLLDIAWHERENTGNKIKRIASGGEGFNRLLRIWIDKIIEVTVNFVGMIAVVAFIDIGVAAIMALFLVTYLIVSRPLSRWASIAAHEVNEREEDYSGLSFEIVNNIRSVKVMGLFQRLYERLRVIGLDVIEKKKKRAFHFRSKTAVQSNWSFFFRLGAFVVIGLGVTHGRYEIGFFVLFNSYFTMLRNSVEELSDFSQDFVENRYNIARLKAIMREPIRIDNDAGKIDFPADWKKISIQNLSFTYGAEPVLKNVSFDILRGKRLGVVGLSGAGKSTIFKLLLKEVENYSGEILIDDMPLRSIKRSSLYQYAAVVLQETEVFNFSVRDNITIANPALVDDTSALKTALTTAHVEDFIEKLPAGIDTLIGEKGVKLSGGEKQRLGIARAIFKQPQLLFLDEATSHLDLESEEKIRDSLHTFFQTVTAVVIAHRLTTIREMDTILVLENGQIIESGSFAELTKQRGRFFDLWEKQKL